MKWYKIIIVVCLCLLAFFIGRCSSPPIKEDIIHRDTTYIHQIDTQFVYKDKIIEKTKTISIKDTIFINDTIYVESKVYQDSFANIFFSGYKAEIDSIQYFIPRDTFYINITQIKKKRWGISIQGGIGVNYGLIHKSFDVGPYIGIGVSYNLFK